MSNYNEIKFKGALNPALIESDPTVPQYGIPIDRETSSPPTLSSPRIYYFDWLRAIAVLGIVIYHALLPFSSAAWFIRNTQQSDLLMAVLFVPQLFGLPILFLVAGASARFALQSRSLHSFLLERTARLLVPFVVGSALMGPLVGYISGLHNGTWSGSFLAFVAAYPRIVLGYNPNIGISPVLLLAFGMHLWFLAWLFLYSAFGSPIFKFLLSSYGRSLVDTLARFARLRGATLLFAVPVTLPILALYAYGAPGRWDWWAFGWFGVVFVVGYIIYSDDRLVAATRRDMALALAVSLLGSAALTALDFAQWAAMPQAYSPLYFLMMSLAGITGWAWSLLLLGAGMRIGFMQQPLPPHTNEVALTTYILHLPIVTAVSYIVVQLPLEIVAKTLINIILGVGISLLVVFAAIRFPLLHPLLGLRRPRPTVV